LVTDYQFPVIVSTHPRTRKKLEEIKGIKMDEKIQFLKPFGFFDYIHLQQHALCTISDSGTISEESAILSFPAISLRNSMERPEAQDAGTIILTGLDVDVVTDSVKIVIDEHAHSQYKQISQEYTIVNTSWRVLKLVQGTAKLSNMWWGVVGD
jgi:UDP-N-acetylglucosamine 2-epimerase (non-hydrolysing)